MRSPQLKEIQKNKGRVKTQVKIQVKIEVKPDKPEGHTLAIMPKAREAKGVRAAPGSNIFKQRFIRFLAKQNAAKQNAAKAKAVKAEAVKAEAF